MALLAIRRTSHGLATVGVVLALVSVLWAVSGVAGLQSGLSGEAFLPSRSDTSRAIDARLLDIDGIYPGMPVTEAEAVLHAEYTGSPWIPGLPGLQLTCSRGYVESVTGPELRCRRDVLGQLDSDAHVLDLLFGQPWHESDSEALYRCGGVQVADRLDVKPMAPVDLSRYALSLDPSVTFTDVRVQMRGRQLLVVSGRSLQSGDVVELVDGHSVDSQDDFDQAIKGTFSEPAGTVRFTHAGRHYILPVWLGAPD